MHSGAHIEYYTPSELLFSVETNDFFPHKFCHSWKKKIGKNLDISFLCKIQWIFLFIENFLKFFTSQLKLEKIKSPLVTMLQPTRKKKLNYIPTWFSPSLPSVINFHLIIPIIIIPFYFYYNDFFSLWVCWILGRNNVSSDYISKIPHMLC